MGLKLKSSHDVELSSLNLVGDGDDLDLIENIEKSFEVKLQDSEVEQWWTVGDIYKHLQSKIEASQEHKSKCAGQMAFYVVRKTLQELVPTDQIKPDTALANLELGTHKSLQSILTQRYQLRTPPIALSSWGCIGILLAWLTGGILLHTLGLSLWYLTILIMIGIAIAAVIPSKFEGTVGSFSMTLADLNYAYFVKNGARSDKLRLWQALGRIIEVETGFKRHELTKRTLLLMPGDYDKEWIEKFKKIHCGEYAELLALLSDAEDILSTYKNQHADFQATLHELKSWIEQLEQEEPVGLQRIEATFAPTGTWDDLSSLMTDRYSREAAELADTITTEIAFIRSRASKND